MVASLAFGYVDYYIFHQLWRMLRRRYSNKSNYSLIKRYRSAAGRKHLFSNFNKYKSKIRLYQVVKVSSIGIGGHVKTKPVANLIYLNTPPISGDAGI
ncbi:MAG: hypothetical protein JSV50_09330 [Desulfobacteraceae bacterium]|nr:MAG: hypothetical protein JSV50_09330 [Desulfobacteraceae bacterium]